MAAQDRPAHGGSRRTAKCPICRRGGIDFALTAGYIAVTCKSCGEYDIEEVLANELRQLHSSDPDYKLCPYLGCYTRQQTEAGQRVQISRRDWRHFAVGHQNTPISRKLDKLLAVLAKRCEAPGGYAEYDLFSDRFLIDAHQGSFMSLLNELVAEKYVEFEPGEHEFPTSITVTALGWLKYEYESIHSDEKAGNYFFKAVSTERASEILGVTDRQIRNLVKAEKLTTVGKGGFKKITIESLLRCAGIQPPSPKEIRNPSEHSGTKRN
jgi:hypothetical protein